jgi:putative redox protein
MGNTTVTWVKGMQFAAVDSTNHSVLLSTTDEGVGMKPSELLLSALGSCTAVDVVSILQKRRQQLTGLEIVVTGEQAEEHPKAFTHFHIRYIVTGVDINPTDVERAINLSEEKYCSVAATLRAGAEITYDYEIVEAGVRV